MEGDAGVASEAEGGGAPDIAGLRGVVEPRGQERARLGRVVFREGAACLVDHLLIGVALLLLGLPLA